MYNVGDKVKGYRRHNGRLTQSHGVIIHIQSTLCLIKWNEVSEPEYATPYEFELDLQEIRNDKINNLLN